jgi:ATP-dependent Lhr-like helicase
VRARNPFGEGRWALLPEANKSDDRDTLAERVALQLLARYGVLVRELYAREPFVVPYREINWALRRLEARGVVRGGRFVNGFVGEQYALPEALAALRKQRRAPLTGEEIVLSAADPLNLTAVILPGPRVPALRRLQVSYRDGERTDEQAALGQAHDPKSETPSCASSA